MIKGIIFDLDGTILNTIEDIRDSVNVIFRKYNLPEVSIEKTKTGVGMGTDFLIDKTVPEGTSEQMKEFLGNEYATYYKEHCEIKTGPFEGILDLLKTLEEKGIKVAVNSNKKQLILEGVLKKYFPGINFLGIYGLREGFPLKPDPAGANELVEIMGLEKSEVLYVGDSEIDMDTAHNANIKVVGCLWGFRNLQVLQEHKADYIISNPKEILDLL